MEGSASPGFPSQGRARGPDKVRLRLEINRGMYEVFAEPRRTLLDVLRKDLGLTGTKKVCDRGQCGACTVLVDGIAAYSCLMLAIECEGKRIETIEGLDSPEGLHPLQRAFIEHDAFQCGFCTPGQIMSLKALYDRAAHPMADEIRGALAGNLCRCGAYSRIVKAGLSVAELSERENEQE